MPDRVSDDCRSREFQAGMQIYIGSPADKAIGKVRREEPANEQP
jgi:hypothetical protein